MCHKGEGDLGDNRKVVDAAICGRCYTAAKAGLFCPTARVPWLGGLTFGANTRRKAGGAEKTGAVEDRIEGFKFLAASVAALAEQTGVHRVSDPDGTVVGRAFLNCHSTSSAW